MPKNNDSQPRPEPTRTGESFEERAARRNASLGRELWDLVRTNRKWWLAPIIIVLIVIGVLFVLGSTAAAPFIYSLF